MSEMDAYEDMGRFFRHSDRDLDRLFDGKAAEAELEDLAAFLSGARAALTQPGDQGTEARHLAAMAEASSSLIEKGDPVARPVSKVIGPAQQVSGLPKQRRVPVMARLLSTKAGKLAALVMGLLMSMTGLAFANVLPNSLQNAFSSAGNVIGLSIPSDDDEGDEAEDEDAGDLEVDDQGDDDQGDDNDDKGDDVKSHNAGTNNDDQGDDNDDDQGQVQTDDDQGDDNDDQGDDSDDQGDDDQGDDDQGTQADNDQGDQGDDDQADDDQGDQTDDDQGVQTDLDEGDDD